jgi:excisionase family DNA binding protein
LSTELRCASAINAGPACDEPLTLVVPPELVDAVVERVLERLSASQPPAIVGFLDVQGAADFLACPKSRIYALVSAGRLPHYRDGSRLLFDREELRAYVRNGGATRP